MREQLRKYVDGLGGVVVEDDEGEVKGCSHYVVFDPAIDAPDSSLRHYLHSDRTYIKTIESLAGQDLVHYWYYPNSFNEWIPTAVGGLGVEQEPAQAVYKKEAEGHVPWIVNCRFLKDSFEWNEVCDEGDYVIEEMLGSKKCQELLVAVDEKVKQHEEDVAAKKEVNGKAKGRTERETPATSANSSQCTRPSSKDLDLVPRVGKNKVEVYPQAMYRSTESVSALHKLGVETTPSATATYIPPAVLPPSAKTEHVMLTCVKKRIGWRGDSEVRAVIADTNRIRGGGEIVGGGEVGGTRKEPEATWFSQNQSEVTDVEKALLGEWFDCSQPHLTPALYATTRNAIIKLYKKDTTKYLSMGDVRKSVVGEYGSILRLWRMLESGGGINYGKVKNTGLPMIAGGRAKGEVDGVTSKKVVDAVAKQIGGGKGATEAAQVIDWKKVGTEVGLEEAEAVAAFLSHDSEVFVEEGGGGGGGGDMLKRMVNGLDDKVVQAAVDAALKAGADLESAKKAGIVGGVAGAAKRKLDKEQGDIDVLHREVMELEYKKWELKRQRVGDMEEILEAERRALLHERRDSYYKRCRFWLGD